MYLVSDHCYNLLLRMKMGFVDDYIHKIRVTKYSKFSARMW
jgi:hypothetical protein